MKITNNQRTASRFAACKVLGLSALFGAATLLGAIEASAHGYISSPKSRVLQCKDNGSTSAACAAAAVVGNAGVHEPQSASRGGALDNHEQIIADGKLCSVGIGGWGGLDLARGDWLSTQVSAGPTTFTWTNTAPHRTSYFRYYITKQGFNPAAAPLRWSDLEQIHQSAPAGREAISTHVVNLPARTGRHIVYSVWQRDKSDAPEGFYQCVDVIYGNSSSVSSTSSSVVTPSSSSAGVVSSSSVSDNTCTGLPTWNATTQYNSPQQVQHSGRRYSANYWTLGNNPAQTSGQYNFWLDLGACSNTSSVSSIAVSSSSRSSVIAPSSSSRSSAITVSSSSAASGNCTSPVFANGTNYANGALVQNGGNEYRCTVSGWCSTGGPYAPGTGWAWANAWSLVRSCQ